MSGSLNKEGLLELLDELSERLRRKKTRASIYIVGGAAMALAFDRSRTTHTSTHGSTRDTGHSSRQSTTSRTAEGFPRAG